MMSNSEISNQNNESESPPSPPPTHPHQTQEPRPILTTNFELPFRLLNGEYLVDLETSNFSVLIIFF